MDKRHAKSLFRPLLVLSMAGPICLALLLAGIQSYQQTQLLGQIAQRHLNDVSVLLASDSQLIAHVPEIATRSQVRVTLLDADGEIVSDSRQAESGSSLVNESDVYLARNFGHGDIRQIRDGVDQTFVTQRLKPEHAPAAYLRVSAPTFDFTTESNQQPIPGRLLHAWWFWLLLVGVTVLTGLAAASVTRRIRRPLLMITNALSQLSQLSWQRHLDIVGRGEIAELGEAFNLAIDSLDAEFSRLDQRGGELEQTAQFLETVLGAMIEGVVVVDSRHAVVYANSAAASLLATRVKSQDMRGRQLLELARHQAIDQILHDIIGGKDRVRVEFSLNSVARTLSLFATRLERGPTIGAVLVLHDVTELRRLEKLRREFVSNVSHELKTPLAAIQAYVETLIDGASADPQACQRFLKGIEDQADRLHQLILDLLRLSRIESGTEAFDIQDVDVAATIAACVSEAAPVAAAREIVIELEDSPTELLVRADANGLRTILSNLLSNAVKYTPRGGRVRLRWLLENDRVRIDVIDTGIGISRAHQPRVFERFYRVDAARSRDMGGTGLGLAIVKHLCQVFGGAVSLHSELGSGSTFTVRLPLGTGTR